MCERTAHVGFGQKEVHLPVVSHREPVDRLIGIGVFLPQFHLLIFFSVIAYLTVVLGACYPLLRRVAEGQE